MHPQIKAVCNTIRRAGSKVQFSLTAPEQSPLGRIVCDVYYRTNIAELATDVNGERIVYGYPHNGGDHSFEFMGSKKDAVALLELIKETMVNSRRTEEELRIVSELAFVAQDILRG